MKVWYSLIVCALWAGVASAQVAPTLPASYEIAVFAAGVNPSSGIPVKAQLLVPFSSATCGLAQAPVPSGAVVNPKNLTFTDPNDATKDCQLAVQAYLWSVPVGSGYVATITAVSASNQRVPGVAPSNPFDIQALPMVAPSRVTIRP